MKFEWDEAKNENNYKKHKVWFEEAQKIFFDPHLRVFFDETHSDSEDRYLAIGSSEVNRILLVVYCDRKSHSIVRIISARKATKKERVFYEEGI